MGFQLLLIRSGWSNPQARLPRATQERVAIATGKAAGAPQLPEFEQPAGDGAQRAVAAGGDAVPPAFLSARRMVDGGTPAGCCRRRWRSPSKPPRWEIRRIIALPSASHDENNAVWRC